MAKSQKKSSREVRKPKAEKPKKQNASNPSAKGNPAGLYQSALFSTHGPIFAVR